MRLIDGRGLGSGALALCGAALLLTQPAAAQAFREEVAEADILVTAERVTADRIDVPVAVTALSGEDILRHNAPTLRDLSRFVPGFYVEAETPSRTFVAIRGLSTDVPDAASEPRIAIFSDGVSQSRRQGSLGELFDIERIEVARGPQSTLYGRGALIGAVNILTRRPDMARHSLQARASYASFDSAQLDAVVNTTLSDAAALRVAGRYRRTDGYVDDLAGGDRFFGSETAAFRASLRIAPTDLASLDLIASYEHNDIGKIAYKSGTFLPADPVTGAVLGDRNPYSGVALSAGAGFPLGDLGGERDLYGLTALANIAVSDDLSLATTTGYRGFRNRNVVDLDGTALQLLTAGEDNEADQLSQEVRLTYRPAGPFVWTLGANYFREDVRRSIPLQIDERLGLPLLLGFLDRRNPTLLPAASYTQPAVLAGLLRGATAARGLAVSPAQAAALARNLQQAHREQYTNWSSTSAAELFGNVAVDIGDRLQLQAGLRFTDESRRVRFLSTTSERSVLAGVLASLRLPAAQATPLLAGLAVPGAPFIPPSAAYPVPLFAVASQPSNGVETHGLDDSGFAWRFTARYEMSATTRLFASYARGRRPKVTSAAAPLSPGGPVAFADLAAETVDNLEAGAKYRSADGRLAIEGAAYLYDYSNFQTQLLQNQRVVSIDAGRARAYGAELELHAQPVRALELVATYAYNHARFRSGLFAGNHFRLAPDHSASGGVIVRLPLAGGEVQIAPSASWRSRVYFDEPNGRPELLTGALLQPLDYRPSQAGYAIADLNIGFAPADRIWRIEAFASNLFDRRYLRDTGAGSISYGLPTYVAAPPRVIGVAFTIGTPE